jgi:hypothetical protein
MMDAQLYFATGLLSAIALIGILVNIGYFVTLNGQMTRLESALTNASSGSSDYRTY